MNGVQTWMQGRGLALNNQNLRLLNPRSSDELPLFLTTQIRVPCIRVCTPYKQFDGNAAR